MEPMELAAMDKKNSVSLAVMGTASSSSASPPGDDTMGGIQNSPCAGCKFLRRKCQPDCVFAPYFPADQPDRFISVHKSFGASNVTKILNDLHPDEREFAVASLVYEANWRIRDQVNGCINDIYALEEKLKDLRFNLSVSVTEMYTYKTALEGHAEENQVSQGIQMEQMHLPIWQQQQLQHLQQQQQQQLQHLQQQQLQHLQQQQLQHLQQQQLMMMGGNGAMVGEVGVDGRAYDPGLAEVIDASTTAFGGQFADFSAAGEQERLGHG